MRGEFLDTIEPFDLLVFKSTGVSAAIIALESISRGVTAECSHVEIAITRGIFPDITADVDRHELLSWGSTLSGDLNDGVLDAETDAVTFGVQVRKLVPLVKYYSATTGHAVGVCKLTPAARARLAVDPALYKKYHDVKYPTRPSHFFSALCSPDYVDESETTTTPVMFCSEFVANLYTDIGVIIDESDGRVDGKIISADDVLPVDLSGQSGLLIGVVDPPIWFCAS